MTLTEEIVAAMGAHGHWKGRLRAAVDKGTSTFTVSTVAVDNLCDFGKFLHTKVDPAAKQSAHWRRCQDLHARFHKEAGRVLQLALAGKKGMAEEAMNAHSEFAKVSRELAAAMLKWRSAAS